jgi:hypothetical protein
VDVIDEQAIGVDLAVEAVAELPQTLEGPSNTAASAISPLPALPRALSLFESVPGQIHFNMDQVQLDHLFAMDAKTLLLNDSENSTPVAAVCGACCTCLCFCSLHRLVAQSRLVAN